MLTQQRLAKAAKANPITYITKDASILDLPW